jgi:hypothetical protein
MSRSVIVQLNRIILSLRRDFSKRNFLLSPGFVVFLWTTLLVLVSVYNSGGDPLSLARLGTYYAEGLEDGTQGYDGQFVYYIAQNLNPKQVEDKLDVPAYRYQRIFLPLLARFFSFGDTLILAWIIPVLGILSLTAGTWALSVLFDEWGVNRWYAIVYGFWAGFSLAIVVDLPEPLAYSLLIGGILALIKRKEAFGWLLLMLAVFAKEVTILFVAAMFLSYLIDFNLRSMIGISVIVFLPYFLFQVWLYSVFGEFGFGAGGNMATSFEWIPLMGLWRIAEFSKQYFFAMVIVFGPSIILPTIWGLVVSIKSLKNDQKNMIVLGLLINSLVMLFLPFSTFRETGGLLRFASGIMLAILLYAGRYRLKRILNYSLFLMVLNVFLLKPVAI